MRLVIIESPYAGNVVRNIVYGRYCMLDSLKRGEAPFLSHLLYTQDGILKDNAPEERRLGIEAGFAWGEKADLRVFYINFGMSTGMQKGLEEANRLGQAIEYRVLGQEIMREMTLATRLFETNGVSEKTVWSGGVDPMAPSN